jgi:4-carboxymuconolactone decarboxylase
MPRVPYPDLAALPEDMRERLAGSPPNVSRMMMGLTPGVYRGFTAFTRSIFDASPLSPQLREIAILRVGHLSNASYEVYQHEAYARHVGLTDKQIAAVREGGDQAKLLGEAGQAVLAFTDDLVKNVRPSDASLSAVRGHLGDAVTMDLVLVIGAYMTVSRFLETTGVEIDEKPIDWGEYNARNKIPSNR